MNHFNILKFYNWYETRNHLWIIFEYCSGGDLMQLIEQDKFVNLYKLFKLFYNELTDPRKCSEILWKRSASRFVLFTFSWDHLL